VAVCRGGQYKADLRNADEADAVIREHRPSVLFHLAGLIYSNNLDELYRSNVVATRHVLEAVSSHVPECRVIVPGSAAEYGRVPPDELPIEERRVPAPVVPYGLAKVWQTATAAYYATRGLRVVVARLFNIVGPGAPASLSVGAFAEQLRGIMSGKMPQRLLVGDLTPRRDFIDVGDACAALVSLASLDDAAGIYNACSGASVSMAEVLELLVRESGLEVEVVLDEARLRYRAEIPDSFGTAERLRSATGWKPVVPLRASLAEMLLVPSGRD